MIPPEKITEVRERIDLIQLIGERVALKKVGHSYKGLCPFHGEKTPSFHVNPERGFFHCFGCGESGSAIDFLMKLDGLSFVEAVSEAARRAGVEIEASSSVLEGRGGDSEGRQRKDDLIRAHEVAVEFFEGVLWSREGEGARRYLEGRGLGEETIRRFRLGWSSGGWEELTRHLAKEGISSRVAEQSGLVVARDRGGSYDRFRQRVLFPIMDLQGRVIAFSGRILPGDTSPAKYLNSPETPLYRKGRHLYGFSQARQEARQRGELLLVEGNLDLLALHQQGLTHSVALLGTALTEDQVSLIRRFVERLVLIFDGDRAGFQAVRRSTEALLRGGLRARVVRLPPGEDPDSFLRSRGREALEQLMGQAKPLLEVLQDDLVAPVGRGIQDRVQVVREFGPYLAMVDDPLERDLLCQRLADLVGIDEAKVGRYLRGGVLPEAARGPGEGGGSLPQVEAETLCLLVEHPELADEARVLALEDFFENPELLELLRVVLEAELPPEPQAFLHRASNRRLKDRLSRIFLGERRYSDESVLSALQECVLTLKRHALEREIGRINVEIAEVSRAGDAVRLAELQKHKMIIARNKADLLRSVSVGRGGELAKSVPIPGVAKESGP